LDFLSAAVKPISQRVSIEQNVDDEQTYVGTWDFGSKKRVPNIKKGVIKTANG